MANDRISEEEKKELAGLLERRLEVIADADLRERDPERQLALLQEVSEAIDAFHGQHRENLSPRLNHFLGNCSFDKALAWIRETV